MKFIQCNHMGELAIGRTFLRNVSSEKGLGYQWHLPIPPQESHKVKGLSEGNGYILDCTPEGASGLRQEWLHARYACEECMSFKVGDFVLMSKIPRESRCIEIAESIRVRIDAIRLPGVWQVRPFNDERMSDTQLLVVTSRYRFDKLERPRTLLEPLPAAQVQINDLEFLSDW